MSGRIIKIVAVMALVVAMAGCASSGSRERSVRTATVERGAGEQGTATVRTGMTMLEVEELWGKPSATRTEVDNPDVEIWTYERHEAAAAATIDGTAKAVVTRTVYTLRFEKGKLVKIDQKIL
jgi:outer membrane protein assembly factor BamE (lipoprotein component of BamABCDE complex)